MGRPFAVMIVTAALIVGGCVSSGEGQRFATSTTGTQPSHASTVPNPGPTESPATIFMPPATSPFGWKVGPAEPADLAGRDFVATFQERVHGNFDAAGAIISFQADNVSVHYSCYVIASANYLLKAGSLLSVDRAGLGVDANGCKPAADYPTMDQFRFVGELLAAMPVVGVDRTHADGLRRVRIQSGSTFLDLVELPASPPQSLPRMLLEAPGWTLVGAGVPPPSPPPPKVADAVWYVEYDGARISHPDGSWTIPHVVIFGYGDEADEVAASLGVFGYQFDPAPTPGVLVARPGGGVAGVAVITVGDGSVLLLSYDLGSQELATLIPSLVSTPLATWVAATVSEYES